MFPLLPFAAGLLTGAVATRLLKAGKARVSLDKAQDRLREATVSSLAAIEHSSAGLRAKLTHPAAAQSQPEAPSPPPEGAAEAAPEGAAKAAPARKTTRRPAARAGKPAASPVKAEKAEKAADEESL